MILNLPLTVPVSRKKKFTLNLNAYRNTHYLVLNNAKIAFKEAVAHLIKPLPFYEKIRLTYTLFPKTHRKADVANVCSVVDKFFSDSLVEFGKLSDDNYDYLPEVSFRFGSVDKSNPRVEVFIESIDHMKINETKNEDDPMQITLNQAEINEAISAYVVTRVNGIDDRSITIDLRATRGEDGYTASLDVQSSPAIRQETDRNRTSNAFTRPDTLAEQITEPTEATPAPVVEEVEEVEPDPVCGLPEPEAVVEDVVEQPVAAATPHKSIFGSKVQQPTANISSGEDVRAEPNVESTVVSMTTASAAQPFADDDSDGGPVEPPVEEEPAAPKKTIFNFKKA